MNLHDWIDELCDVLDLETEVDEALISELAAIAHDNVDPDAGPVTTFLLGYAAGRRQAGPVTVERLAGRATELAEGWDRPAVAPGLLETVDVGAITDLDDLDPLDLGVDDEDPDD